MVGAEHPQKLVKSLMYKSFRMDLFCLKKSKSNVFWVGSEINKHEWIILQIADSIA